MPSLPPLAVRAVRWVAPVGGLFVAALSLDLLEARADEDDEAAAAVANTLVVGAGWSGPPDLDAATRRGRFVVIVERGAPGASRPLRLELEVEVERAAHLPQLAAYAAHVHDAVAVAAAAVDVNDEFDVDAFEDLVFAEVDAVVPVRVVAVDVTHVIVQ